MTPRSGDDRRRVPAHAPPPLSTPRHVPPPPAAADRGRADGAADGGGAAGAGTGRRGRPGPLDRRRRDESAGDDRLVAAGRPARRRREREDRRQSAAGRPLARESADGGRRPAAGLQQRHLRRRHRGDRLQGGAAAEKRLSLPRRGRHAPARQVRGRRQEAELGQIGRRHADAETRPRGERHRDARGRDRRRGSGPSRDAAAAARPGRRHLRVGVQRRRQGEADERAVGLTRLQGAQRPGDAVLRHRHVPRRRPRLRRHAAPGTTVTVKLDPSKVYRGFGADAGNGDARSAGRGRHSVRDGEDEERAPTQSPSSGGGGGTGGGDWSGGGDTTYTPPVSSPPVTPAATPTPPPTPKPRPQREPRRAPEPTPAPAGETVDGYLLASADVELAAAGGSAAEQARAEAARLPQPDDDPLQVPTAVWVAVGLLALVVLGWGLESRTTLPYFRP